MALVTLGCGRNEVDSAQVGGMLEAAGFTLVDDPAQADCAVVNTCTFIEPARQESVDTILDVAAVANRVVVIGCMAQRYGVELARALPEAAAVVGFSDYPRLPQIVHTLVAGPCDQDPWPTAGHALPLVTPSPAPAGRAHGAPAAPPNAPFPVRTVPRGPWAYLKVAGGCDRACTFCTIPSYRGRFSSRTLEEIVAEARWLVDHGARELVCVSENTTSWGKDLPAGRGSQQALLEGFERVEGLLRVRLLYLQPAELRPELLDAMAASPVVASYYDLSLQHAAPSVVQRMGRSGGAQRFLELIGSIRARDPAAVFRSSFIVGFPGETEEDVVLLEEFLVEAGLDWPAFFTYSAEEGTRAAALPGQVPADEARSRRDRLLDVAEALAEARADEFVGRVLDVLVEGRDGNDALGRSYREAPETDGEVRVLDTPGDAGAVVRARVVATDGVDLTALPVPRGGAEAGAADALGMARRGRGTAVATPAP